MRCINCDKKIKQTELTGTWYHKKSRAVYCMADIKKAEPKR